MQPYWTDGEREVWQGDAWALAGQLAPASVDCLMTSPPYWGLRDYGVEGQCGLEAHPQEWLDKLVDLFVRLRPALKPTATLWVNLGDTYGKCIRDGWVRPKQLLLLPERFAIAMQDAGFLLRNDIAWTKPNAICESAGDRFSRKWEHLFLFTLAERYYFDLEAVRVPLSDPKRMRGEADVVGGRSWRERGQHSQGGAVRRCGRNSQVCRDRDPDHPEARKRNPEDEAHNPSGANPGDVWSICPAPFPEAHFATFPPELVRRCLLAGGPREVCAECGKPTVREMAVSYGPKPGWGPGSANARRREIRDGAVQAWDAKPRLQREVDTLGWRPTCDCGAAFEPGLVLDPFLGSGTTLCVAKELGLRGIGFELNPTYCAMAARRIADWRRPKAMVAAEANGQATLFDATAAGKGAGAPGGGVLSARCSVLTPEEEVAAG